MLAFFSLGHVFHCPCLIYSEMVSLSHMCHCCHLCFHVYTNCLGQFSERHVVLGQLFCWALSNLFGNDDNFHTSVTHAILAFLVYGNFLRELFTCTVYVNCLREFSKAHCLYDSCQTNICWQQHMYHPLWRMTPTFIINHTIMWWCMLSNMQQDVLLSLYSLFSTP